MNLRQGSDFSSCKHGWELPWFISCVMPCFAALVKAYVYRRCNPLAGGFSRGSVVTRIMIFDEYDAAILVDCGSRSRIGERAAV